MPGTSRLKADNSASNYISNDKDNARPIQRRRSPRLNKSLERREWGYKAHTDWTENNNFADAIVRPNTDKTLEYRDLIHS